MYMSGPEPSSSSLIPNINHSTKDVVRKARIRRGGIPHNPNTNQEELRRASRCPFQEMVVGALDYIHRLFPHYPTAGVSPSHPYFKSALTTRTPHGPDRNMNMNMDIPLTLHCII